MTLAGKLWAARHGQYEAKPFDQDNGQGHLHVASSRHISQVNAPIINDLVSNDHIDQATQKLIDNLRLMKRTRFNAQARFEAKHGASVAAFTLATVIEISLSLAGVNFSSSISSNVASFIEFASQVTAVLILGFGLVVGLGNYQTRALYMQRCAMDWGNLSKELQIARPVDRETLQDYRRRYHEIEGQCPPNHSEIDYHRAIRDKNHPSNKGADHLDYYIDVYLIYAVAGIAYIAFWLTFWHSIAA